MLPRLAAGDAQFVVKAGHGVKGFGQAPLFQVEPSFASARNTDSVVEEGALGWQ